MAVNRRVRAGPPLGPAVVLAASLAWAVPGTPLPLAAQGPWRVAGNVSGLLRLESGTDAGLEARLSLGRRQTPRVEIRGALGVLWFPERVETFRFRAPPGDSVTERRTEELTGPYASITAARVLEAGSSELLLQVEIALGLLREETSFATDPPDVGRPGRFTDWEVVPTWGAATILRLPAPAGTGIRPELAARLRTLLAVGDGFVPVASLSAGLGLR